MRIGLLTKDEIFAKYGVSSLSELQTIFKQETRIYNFYKAKVDEHVEKKTEIASTRNIAINEYNAISDQIEALEVKRQELSIKIRNLDRQLSENLDILQAHSRSRDQYCQVFYSIEALFVSERPVDLSAKIKAYIRSEYKKHWDHCIKQGYRGFSFEGWLKWILYDALGGYKCHKCGNTNWDVLQLGHINDDGNLDRARFGSRIKMLMYYVYYIKEAKEKLQVVCFNCNLEKERKRRRDKKLRA